MSIAVSRLNRNDRLSPNAGITGLSANGPETAGSQRVSGHSDGLFECLEGSVRSSHADVQEGGDCPSSQARRPCRWATYGVLHLNDEKSLTQRRGSSILFQTPPRGERLSLISSRP
jgi:hypothetical protein